MNQNASLKRMTLVGRRAPACVDMEQAASMFGWPYSHLRTLVNAGHLKQLGKPEQEDLKWFATVEIERMCSDPNWLEMAIRVVQIENKKARDRQGPWPDENR